jgi:hypothetical protein
MPSKLSLSVMQGVETQRNEANQKKMSQSVLVTRRYDGTMPREVHVNDEVVPSHPVAS